MQGGWPRVASALPRLQRSPLHAALDRRRTTEGRCGTAGLTRARTSGSVTASQQHFGFRQTHSRACAFPTLCSALDHVTIASI